MGTTTVSVGNQINAPGGQIAVDTKMQPGDWAISGNSEYVLVMQGDGNLVLYEVAGTPPTPGSSFQGYPTWASQTYGNAGAFFVVQADGNLVVYSGTNALWASGTQGNRLGYLLLQADGDMALYDAAGVPIWHTGTEVDMPSLAPTLQNAATGRFDYRTVAWHDMNNVGNNGQTPSVALTSDTLVIEGGYQYDHYAMGGSGSGTIKLEVQLTGSVTCAVSAAIQGLPFETVDFASNGTWQKDDGGFSCTLANGAALSVAPFDGGGGWYPGVEVQFSGSQPVQGFCFENTSGGAAPASVGTKKLRVMSPKG